VHDHFLVRFWRTMTEGGTCTADARDRARSIALVLRCGW
jgi:hypothetical protein